MIANLNKLVAQKYIIQIDDIHKRHAINGKIPESYNHRIFLLGSEARDNAEVMLHAIEKCENHFIGQHIGKFLSNDVEFLKKAVALNPGIYLYASSRARNDIDLSKQAIKGNSFIYKFVGDQLTENKDIAMFAMKTHTSTYQYMSPTLQADKDVVYCAVTKGALSQSETRSLLDAFNFNIVPNELQTDFQFMKKVASVIHEDDNEYFRCILQHKNCEKFKECAGESGSVFKAMQSWELSESLQIKLKPKAQIQSSRMKI